jgi:ABC-type cobalamin/Fe3+-siderophores transport system ATPase subunit
MRRATHAKKQGAKRRKHLRPGRLMRLMQGGCSISELADELGCTQMVVQTWVEMVSGQRQRVLVARAAAKTTPLEEWLKGLS